MPASKLHPSGQAGLRLLAFDGGGLRAISPALIVRDMLHRLEEDQHLSRPAKLSDYCDMICGSGLGGLLAIMTGVLEMTGDQFVEEFVGLCKAVFSDQLCIEQRTSRLEDEMKRIISQYSEGKGERKIVSNEDRCKTFVCAAPTHNVSHARLFRNYRSRTNTSLNCTLWEASRATTATPGLFSPITIGPEHIGESFISGELGWNNPTHELTEEAALVFKDRRISCIINIGSGHPGHLSFSNGLSDLFSRITMDCERAAETMERRFRKVPGVYTRLSVEQGMQSLDVKFSNLHEVVSHAQSYLQGPHVTRNIDSLLRDLVLRPGRIFVDMISGVVPSIVESLHPSLCPQPTPYFTGRQVELRSLEDHFTSDSKSCRVGVLYGIGGGGKTQIGLEFIRRCQHQFSEIFFVDASDKLTLETNLKAIARGSSDKPSVDDALRLLWTRRENWLLFFDNADDTSLDLRPYVSWPHGNVLITTRNREVRSHAPKCSIWVDRLGVEDATELLLRGVDIQRSSEVQELALKIVQELEYLALAINQARAFLTNSVCTLNEYLLVYTRNRKKLLEDKTFQSTDDYQYSVYTTWTISFNKLSHDAALLLELLSFMHHESIPSHLFEDAWNNRNREKDGAIPHVIVTFLSTFTTVDSTWDILRFRELIREILSFSLLEFNVTNYSISLHPLVRQWAQHHTQRHAEVVCGAQTLLSLAIPTGTTSQDYATRVAFLPHLRESMKAGVKVHYTFLRRVGRAYRHGGMFLESSEFFQRGLSEAQQSGASHLRLLTFMSELARAYRDLGQTWEAKLLNEEEVELRKQAQGNEHPSTLTSMSNLALVYSSIGQYQDALQLNEQVVQLSTRVMGTEHPRTLTSMSNLACVYSELGQYQDALKLNEQVLRLRKQVLGEEHPSTLASMSNLAGVHSNLGQYQNALKLNEQVIELKKRVLGVEHPDTLATMSNLAEVYLALGRHQDAFKLNEEVLELMTRVLGREHPDTLVSMSNLAWIYSDLGQQEDALRLHERVLDLRRHSLGPEHPDTVNSSIWIAQLQVTRIEVGTEPQQRRILDKVKHFFTFSFK